MILLRYRRSNSGRQLHGWTLSVPARASTSYVSWTKRGLTRSIARPNKPRPSKPKLLDWLPNVPGLQKNNDSKPPRRAAAEEAERLERKRRREERIEAHRLEAEKREAEQREAERLEAERIELERLQAQIDELERADKPSHEQ